MSKIRPSVVAAKSFAAASYVAVSTTATAAVVLGGLPLVPAVAAIGAAAYLANEVYGSADSFQDMEDACDVHVRNRR